MKQLTIPANYNKLTQTERRKVRERYAKIQDGKCSYCGCDLEQGPPIHLQKKYVNLSLFPDGFLKNPVHLHHDHKTGMTIGAVHARCNAILWQYHKE